MISISRSVTTTVYDLDGGWVVRKTYNQLVIYAVYTHKLLYPEIFTYTHIICPATVCLVNVSTKQHTRTSFDSATQRRALHLFTTFHTHFTERSAHLASSDSIFFSFLFCVATFGPQTQNPIVQMLTKYTRDISHHRNVCNIKHIHPARQHEHIDKQNAPPRA